MAEPVGKAVLAVVQKDCKSLTCPFRQGDADQERSKLESDIEKKLEYRVADGNSVRAHQKRIKQLEATIEKLLKIGADRKLTAKEVLQAKAVLLQPSKEGT